MVPVYASEWDGWTEWYDVDSIPMRRDNVLRYAAADPGRFQLWWEGPYTCISGRKQGEGKDNCFGKRTGKRTGKRWAKAEPGTGSAPSDDGAQTPFVDDTVSHYDAGSAPSEDGSTSTAGRKHRRIQISKSGGSTITIEEW